MTEAITVKDAARILGISARMMYSLAAPAGDVATIGQNSPTTHGPSPAPTAAPNLSAGKQTRTAPNDRVERPGAASGDRSARTTGCAANGDTQ